MASVSTQTASTNLKLTRYRNQVPLHNVAPPDLLRCLLVSLSDHRTGLLRTAAENESWKVAVCKDVKQFMRSIFRLKTPLTIVDLPQLDVDDYAKLRDAAGRAREVSDTLLIVCGAGQNPDEEIWARQLGVWTYLPEATDPEGLELVFREARKALAQQATACVDSCGQLPSLGNRPYSVACNPEQQSK